MNYNSNTATTDYVILLFSKQFLPYIIHPSRVTDGSSSLIDNILANISDNETVSGKILTHITDHFPQFLLVKHAGISYKNLSYYQHDFSQLNSENLLNDFRDLDLAFLDDNFSNVDSKFNRFLSILQDLVKGHAPLKRLSKSDIKFRNKQWINSKTRKMMHIRDRLLGKFRKNNDESLKDLNKKFRNRVSDSLRESKARYFYNYFLRNSYNMK